MNKNMAEEFRVKYDAEFEKEGEGEESALYEMIDEFDALQGENLESNEAGFSLDWTFFEDGSVLVSTSEGAEPRMLEAFASEEAMREAVQSRIESGSWK